MLTTVAQQNPFPGLRPFREDESHLFFGRQKQINELLQIVKQIRFLAILGASGSGKSSLVNCGMIPNLKADKASDWQVVKFTPGNSPYENMARSFVENIFEEEKNTPDKAYQKSLIEAGLRRGDNGLIELYKEHETLHKAKLLIVIDQFEEIFRFRKQEIQTNTPQQDTTSFINLLLQTVQSKTLPIYIVFTMRSDYLGDCTLFRGLTEAINDGQYLVPRMTLEEQEAAIVGPISVGGAKASPLLVNKLLEEVGDEPDRLPILQHALMRTWDYWKKHERPDILIDLKHYNAIGGMSASLSRHAEEAYSELQSKREKQICEVMFKALTEKGIDSNGTRRPLRLAEISKVANANAKEVKRVIEVFRQQGRSFLMPASSVSLDLDTVIDISHESLMRVWQRLIDWVDAEQESADTYIRLASAAALYQQSESGLWRNPELQLALRWREVNQPNAEWAKRYNPSYERAISFLEYSQKQYEFEIAEKERRQQLRLKRTRWVAIAVGIAAILALILATYAIFQRAEAENQKLLADEQRLKAVSNEAEAIKQKNIADGARQEAQENELEAINQRNIATLQRTEAIRQKEEAQRQKDEANRQRLIAESQRMIADSLRDIAVASEAIAKEQKDEALKQKGIAQSERTKAMQSAKIALENAKEAERLKNLALARNQALEAIQTINSGDVKKGTKDAIQAYSLNIENNGPHQNDDNYQALHYASLANYPNAYLHPQQSSVKAIAVSNTPNEWAIANEEGKVTILKSKSNIEVKASFNADNEQLLGLAFTEDNKRIFTASYEGNLSLWRTVPTGKKVKPIFTKSYGSPILNIVSLRKDAIVAHTDRQVFIENATSASIITTDKKAYSNISSVKASKNGDRLIVASGKALHLHTIDDDLRFKNAQTISLKRAITQVAISEDNTHIAAGFENGEVAIIQLKPDFTSQNITYIKAHRTQISGLAFYQHSDFLQLASSSYDNTAQLLDVTHLNDKEQPQDKIILRGHSQWIYNLAFSTDGKYIYTINEDKTMRIWHTQIEDMVQNLNKK